MDFGVWDAAEDMVSFSVPESEEIQVAHLLCRHFQGPVFDGPVRQHLLSALRAAFGGGGELGDVVEQGGGPAAQAVFPGLFHGP